MARKRTATVAENSGIAVAPGEDSSVYDFATSGEFLLARDWKPQGNPVWPECRWLDPQAPSRNSEEKIPVTYRDREGNVVPLLRDAGRQPHKDLQPVYQVQKTFKSKPVTTQEALEIQLAREKQSE